MVDNLDYSAFVDTAMRGVVREVLRQVQRTGLPDKHHFFISFRTSHPGVSMSDTLRSKYPEEITIVLQHQFWDLYVAEDHFKVSLSFNNIPEKLFVPFSALVGFADPSVKFGLQFHNEDDNATQATEPVKAAVPMATAPAAVEEGEKTSAKVIAFDAFRKK